MDNVNDKYRRVLDLPPLDYSALRSNNAAFLLDTSDPDEKISWEKGLLPNKSSPNDLDASKCDDFEDPRGYYSILGCGKISNDAKIRDFLLQEKATFRHISLAKHPEKSSNPKYHNEFKIANNKW